MALYFLIKSNEPTFRTVVFKFKASYEHFMGWKVLINYSNENVDDTINYFCALVALQSWWSISLSGLNVASTSISDT